MLVVTETIKECEKSTYAGRCLTCAYYKTHDARITRVYAYKKNLRSRRSII